MGAYADEFLAMVTEDVVGSVYKVVTWSSFRVTRRSFHVTQRHKASGGKQMFATVSQVHIRTSDSS